MSSETSSIDRWTGRFFSRVEIDRPKTSPAPDTMKPRARSAQPLMAPPRNFSMARLGSWRFASPPPAWGAAARATDVSMAGRFMAGTGCLRCADDPPWTPREARHTTEPVPPPQDGELPGPPGAVYRPRSVPSTPFAPFRIRPGDPLPETETHAARTLGAPLVVDPAEPSAPRFAPTALGRIAAGSAADRQEACRDAGGQVSGTPGHERACLQGAAHRARVVAGCRA